jgi:hypothetical protein
MAKRKPADRVRITLTVESAQHAAYALHWLRQHLIEKHNAKPQDVAVLSGVISTLVDAACPIPSVGGRK